MKTIKQLFIYTSALILFATTGCIDELDINGNGIAATEGRIARNFTKVKSAGSFDVHITHGDVYEVVVRAEENILPYIETTVVNDMLKIDIRGFHLVRNRLPMEVFITTPFVDEIIQSGSGNITTDYFSARNFNFLISGSGSISTSVDADEIQGTISGSGAINLSGNADLATLLVSGSGRMDAYNFSVTDCKATISGSGNILVEVERFLDANISGSGNIMYTGSPNVQSRISGSGRVIKNR